MKTNSLKKRKENLIINYITKSLYIISLMALLIDCKKESDDNNTLIVGEITDIGLPDGESVSKVIGTSGGSILSSDSRLEVIIPPGVLSSDINLTVQPITNTTPGGTGKAYRVSTGEETFNYPVTLRLHYTPDDLEGTVEEALGIAVQDSVGIWHSPYQFTIDTIARTIGITLTDNFNQTVITKKNTVNAPARLTNHFRDLSVYTRYRLIAEKSTLKINEQTIIKLKSFQTDRPLPGNTDGDGDGDELAFLPGFYDYPDASNIVWTVDDKINGDETKGTVSGGNPTTYTAPSIVPSFNSVIVTAEISNIATQGDKLLLSKRIIIKDAGYKYKLTLNYKLTGTSTAFTDVYTDYAELKISVVNYVVTISDTINKKPTCEPSSGVSQYNPSCTYYWVPDNIGMLNIKYCTGYVIDVGNGTYMLSVSITQGENISPHWKAICNSVINDLGESSVPFGPPIGFSFFLNDSTQEQKDGNVDAKLIPI